MLPRIPDLQSPIAIAENVIDVGMQIDIRINNDNVGAIIRRKDFVDRTYSQEQKALERTAVEKIELAQRLSKLAIK